MTSPYVGLTVVLKLQNGGVIQGLVNALDPATASLQLHEVFYPATGQRLGNQTLHGQEIADISLVESPIPELRNENEKPSSQRPSTNSTARHEVPHHIPLEQPKQEPFVDPAILSFHRKPSSTSDFAVAVEKTQSIPLEAPATPMKVLIPTVVDSLPQNTSPFIGVPRMAHGGPSTKVSGRKKGTNAAATLQAPFSHLDINSTTEQEQLDDTDGPVVPADNTRRVSITKTRTGKPMHDTPFVPGASKSRKKKTRRDGTAQGSLDMGDSPEVNRKGYGNGTFPRGKGWRQTPILQDQHVTSIPIVPSVSGRSGKKQRAMDIEAQNNGWGTEDATDIQEKPEFDFADNLAKFDKHTVFAQIRTEDHTADEERLVSFNRVPARPGTYGGKNLHTSENVLDSPQFVPHRTSDSDSDATFDIESVRTTKSVIRSRASSKRPARRQNGSIVDDNVSFRELPRAARSLRTSAYAGSSSHPTAGSPTPARFTPPASPSASQIIQTAHFRIDTSNRACPTITPGVLAAIEEVAEVEIGLPVEVMTESAGRGIAEVAMAKLGSGSKRSTRENSRMESRSVAVVLVGNHRAGARALAAARHLCGRGVRILACILGSDRKTVEIERDVHKQAEILSKLGGVVRGWTDVRTYLRRLDTDAQPELVIEALLSPSKPFDSLGVEDQRAVIEMVAYMNKSGSGRDGILSLDIPSGLNGSTGEAVLTDALEPLQLRATNIVCLGAPRIGLLRAMQRAAILTSPPKIAYPLHWQIWVIDIGINKAWKQSGMSTSRVVRFGNEWIVPLKMFEGGAGDGG